MHNLRSAFSLLGIFVSMLFVPGTALADSTSSSAQPSKKNDVIQILSVDGKPAYHVTATLFNCESGAVLAGPIESGDDGSVRWPQVEDGKACVRVDRLPSSGSTADVVDHAAKPSRVDVRLSPVTPTWSEYNLPFALCAGFVLLVSVPILQFLVGPWAARRNKLVGILAGAPLRLYYLRFRANVDIAKGKKPSDKSLNDQDFNAAFNRDFGSWYGRRYYVLPVILLVAVTGCCAWWGALEVRGWIDGMRSIDSMAGLAAAALTGGFMWVISDEIDRLRRCDFTTSDVYYYVFRILLSIPFAWAVTRLQLTLQVGIPTAIFLGAFPTSSLLTIARRFGSQRLGLGDDPGTGELELEKLQSIGKTNAERFKEADVSNIGQLTRVDPVDLAIRTNFDFDYISDCVNEALLWVYVGDETGRLAVFSVRGACEARQLMDDFNDADATKKARATQTLKDIVAALAAEKVTLTEESLVETLLQVGEDPYTEFLEKIWR
jgi:hypothetical protein